MRFASIRNQEQKLQREPAMGSKRFREIAEFCFKLQHPRTDVGIANPPATPGCGHSHIIGSYIKQMADGLGLAVLTVTTPRSITIH